MSKSILDLEDCHIADTGEVLVKYDAVFKLFRNDERIDGIKVFEHEDVRLYNMRRSENILQIGHMDGVTEVPPVSAYDFNIPGKYLTLDVEEHLAGKLVEKFPELPEEYMDRLVLELNMMRDREMEGLLRVLVYLFDTFESNNVVYGIGRGSACASLVLFLIGIHMVDPIKYDIPIGEFLR